MEQENIQAERESFLSQTGTVRAHILEGTPDDIVRRYEALASNARHSSYGFLDEDVVVIDTETTGFSLNHDELTQIAAARMKNGVITEWFVTFVNPGRPIPEDVAHLTIIHDEDVASAPDPEQAVSKLVEFVGTSYLVAHNAEFDRNFTTKGLSGKPLLENVWIDSLDLARIALPRLKSHRLIDLVKTFDTPVSTHRADADVEALCAVYRILLAAVDAMPRGLVAEIARMADPDEWPTVRVFRYFAECSKAASEQEQDEESEKRYEPFSLCDVRRHRVTACEREKKHDADAIVADQSGELTFPSKEEIDAAFDSDGLVGSLYEEFESRGEQVRMAEAVRDVFEHSTNLAVEAGTGVGKSMAYLVPAVLTALRNNIAIGIATKTNALLDQLVFKELPLLDTALRASGATGIDYAALKGFSHYPCLRQIDRIIKGGPRQRTVAGQDYPQAPSLAALVSFIEQTAYDDIDSLKIDYRVLPRAAITTTSNECLRRKCPFFGAACFVHGARRHAESADIVVTNHSLLFCDLMADGGLLPPVRYWVVDEAHGMESEARKAFSIELSAEELLRIASRVSADEATRNVFIRIERRLGDAPDGSTLLYGLTSKARAAGKTFAQAAEEFAIHMKDLLYFDASKRSKSYEFVDLWINSQIRSSHTFAGLQSYGKLLVDAAEKLVKACQDLVAYLEGIDGVAELQREVAATALFLKEALNAAELILFAAPPEYAYAAHLSRKKDRTAESLQALMLDVGERMNDTLFANTHSVVLASATLTVDGTFSSFERAVGLNRSEASQTALLELPSSYDFDRQMTVYVVNDIPEPNDPSYLAALQQLLIEVHRAQQGSMLTLFTNRKEMEKCFDVVQPALKESELRLVCQKWGVSVKGLRDDFLADEHLSLFALKSFWEGFDAPGATLKGVVIPKLPFSKPSDPLSCERADRDPQAWSHYVLPAAIIETKQAAGRLIRKASDEGSLILADRRLITKGYGKAFLNSLPSRMIKVCSTEEVARFLAEREERVGR